MTKHVILAPDTSVAKKRIVLGSSNSAPTTVQAAPPIIIRRRVVAPPVVQSTVTSPPTAQRFQKQTRDEIMADFVKLMFEEPAPRPQRKNTAGTGA